MLNKWHQLGYTESYSEIQNYKCCFLNGRSGDGAPDTSDTLDTIVEESGDQINDWWVCDWCLLHFSSYQWRQPVKVKCRVKRSGGLYGAWGNKQCSHSVCRGQYTFKHYPYSWKHCLPFNGLISHLAGTTFARSTDPQLSPGWSWRQSTMLRSWEELKWRFFHLLTETDRNEHHHVSAHRWALFISGSSPATPLSGRYTQNVWPWMTSERDSRSLIPWMSQKWRNTAMAPAPCRVDGCIISVRPTYAPVHLLTYLLAYLRSWLCAYKAVNISETVEQLKIELKLLLTACIK